MKLDEARIVLRQRTVSEILDLALRVTTDAALGLFLKLGAIFLLPGILVCLAARYLLEWEWAAVWLLAFMVMTLVQGVYTVAIGRLMFAQELRVWDVVKGYFGRLFPYIGALFVSRLVLGLGVIFSFFILPLFYAWARVMFIHEACLLEQAGPVDSTQRSSRMVASEGFGQPLGFLLSITMAQFLFVSAFESIFNTGVLEFILQIGTPFGSLWNDGGSPWALVGLFASVPYVATARFLAYVDRRTRRDGWDIQIRFMAIAQEERESSMGGRAA